MPPTVLFVDDEPRVTRSFAVTLRREPYEVLTANSPREALAILEERAVDIVVTDEHMPDMTGNDLLARVRDLRPATVRIMITGGGTLRTAMAAINSGAVFRYLEKPCSREDLLQCLAAAADARTQLQRVVAASGAIAAEKEVSADFDRAMGGIWLAVQPIIRPSIGDTFAYEALVRSTDPAIPHGGAFVELAERCGRMAELEWEVHSRAAVVAASLPTGTSLFVNVHPCSLEEPWFATDRDPLMAVASRIVLEITEGTTMGEVERARARIDAARRAGFRIALDDVGAGQAGLGLIASLQPEFAKLDRELVRDVQLSPVRMKVARGLAAMCRELEIELLVEGVETVAEYDAFRSWECDLFQGFLFARPARPFPGIVWPAELAA
jgi:EAL domain-containing protein (putative c-di-GMP-specific phosphodiesterase class I)/CheY-like chemotaxis protein